MGGAEEEDEEREEDEAPEEAGEELARGAAGEAEAVGGEPTALDAGEGDRAEEDDEEEEAVLADGAGGGELGWAAGGVGGRGVCRGCGALVAESGLQREDEDGEQSEEEEEAPAGAQAVAAEEDGPEGGRAGRCG